MTTPEEVEEAVNRARQIVLYHLESRTNHPDTVKAAAILSKLPPFLKAAMEYAAYRSRIGVTTPEEVEEAVKVARVTLANQAAWTSGELRDNCRTAAAVLSKLPPFLKAAMNKGLTCSRKARDYDEILLFDRYDKEFNEQWRALMAPPEVKE